MWLYDTGIRSSASNANRLSTGIRCITSDSRWKPNENVMHCIRFSYTTREFDVVHRIPTYPKGSRCTTSESRWKGGFINYEIAILSVMLLPKLVTFWAILGFKVPTVMIYFRGWVKLITKYILHFHSEPRQKVKISMLKIKSPTKRGFHSFLPKKSRRMLFEYGGDSTSKYSVG